MCFNQPISYRMGVFDEFQDPTLGCQRDDLVFSDIQQASPCFSIAMKNAVDKVEYLLHDSILPQIILTLTLELKDRQ